ncbi:MAG TPA: PQQ-binding-like beta-propeller repeat protein [Ktedonobacterales bacterium]
MASRRVSCALALRLTLVGCGLLSLTACSPLIPTTQHRSTPTPRPHPLTFVTTKDSLYALDTGDGSVRWRAPVGTVGYYPAVASSRANIILLPTSRQSFLAIRAADGSTLWQRSYPYSYLAATNDVVVFTTEQQTGSVLSAVRVATGRQIWQMETDSLPARVLFDGDTMLVTMWDPDALSCLGYGMSYGRLRILALNILDGSVRWAADNPQQQLWDMAAENGTVYWSAQDEGCDHPHQLCATDAATGKLRWRVATDQDFHLEQVVNGILYGWSATGVDAYRGKDGALLWRSGRRRDGLIAASATRVLIAKPDGQVVAVDPPNGYVLWSLAVTGVRYLEVLDGTLYATEHTISNQWTIVAHEMTTGRVRWNVTLSYLYPSLAVADGKLIALQAEFGRCSGGLSSDVTLTALGTTTGDTVWERVLPKTITSETPTPTIHARSLC